MAADHPEQCANGHVPTVGGAAAAEGDVVKALGEGWTADELRQHRDLLPERLEVREERLLWDDEERLALLAMLPENVGIDRAVRLGDPERWRAAIAELGA